MVHDAVLLVLGAFLAFVVAFFYDMSGWKTRAASANSRLARRRLSQLEQSRATVDRFHGDKPALTGYLVARLILATALSLLDLVVQGVQNLIQQGWYGFDVFTTKPVLVKSPDEMLALTQQTVVQTQLNVAFSFVMTIFEFALYFVAFTIAYRAYRVWRRVENYDEYDATVQAETQKLRTSIHGATVDDH